MVERQDIDALLISALYGELTPADEARLAAHLESHPTDRTALADLTRARDAVRESRILQVQLDPPQSVSALLMQEAARRAPARKDGAEGWLARFFRSFMAHPAMAAAAMLVVVIGVATMVAKRKPDMVESSVQPQPQPQMSAPATSAAGSAATPPAQDTTTLAAENAKNEAQVAADQLQQGSAFRVGLVEPADSKADATKEAKDEGAKGGESPKPVVADKSPPAKAAGPAAHRGGDSYVELRKQEQVPKDLEEAAPAKKQKFARDADGESDEIVSTTTLDGNAETSRPAPGRFAGGGGVSTGGNITAAPPPPPPAPRATSTPAPGTVTRSDRTEKSAVQQAPSATAAPAEGKPADPTLAWAQVQHRNLVAQVTAGNCRDAAGLALEISNRAPGYYQQNVANDRAVKKCMPYIADARERQAEERAAKNRASATKRAADEPARAKAAEPAKPTTK